MSVVQITKRARCFAAFAVIVETYDTPRERLAFIQRLRDRDIISPMSADLLIEHFSLEAA